MAATTSNVSLDIKYIFISFAQQFFKDHGTYIWDTDVRKTKLLIADKNAIDVGVAERRPAIILSRGPFNFQVSSMGQRVPGGLQFVQRGGYESLSGPELSGDRKKTALYSDLISGSVTYHILAKYGVQAEEIANDLFIALSGYREDLKGKGVNRITSMGFGEESLLRTTSNIDLSGVALNIGFLKQVTIARGDRNYNCRVYVGSTEVYENIGFKATTDSGTGATQIVFNSAPEEDSTIKCTYVHAITLETHTLVDLVGTVDGVNTIFTIPNSGQIYGYYKILDSYGLTVDNKVEYEDL